MTDNANDPTNVPIPVALDTNDTSVASHLNQKQTIGEDLRIDPDPTLNGYQEDIDAGKDADILENESGTSPTELTTMPEPVLKEELDALAIDEQEATPDDSIDEDRREHVEDMDENDKRDN